MKKKYIEPKVYYSEIEDEVLAGASEYHGYGNAKSMNIVEDTPEEDAPAYPTTRSLWDE